MCACRARTHNKVSPTLLSYSTVFIKFLIHPSVMPFCVYFIVFITTVNGPPFIAARIYRHNTDHVRMDNTAKPQMEF